MKKNPFPPRRPEVLTFSSNQQAAAARSACKRLLASMQVYLTEHQRTVVNELLDDLTPVGIESGVWEIPREPDRMRALYLAMSRQVSAHAGAADRNSPAAVLGPILEQITEYRSWPVARSEVVTFVRLGFGDGHGIGVRSLNFEVEIPDRTTLEMALIDGIQGYNQMSGTKAAAMLGPLWDDVGSVYLGRRNDPIMRVQIPHTRQQRNGGDNRQAIPLTGEEVTELCQRLIAAARECEATPLIVAPGGGNYLFTLPAPPARPSEIHLLWQS